MARVGSVVMAALLVASGVACDVHEPVSIPAGARVVHVTANGDAVSVEPASVPPGDVYVVLEGPNPGIGFVSSKLSPDAPATGMSQAQLDRLAQGDYQGTQLEGFGVTCAADAWTEERHWQGCGENVKLTLAEGLYAFVTEDGETGVPPMMAVLEVAP